MALGSGSGFCLFLFSVMFGLCLFFGLVFCLFVNWRRRMGKQIGIMTSGENGGSFSLGCFFGMGILATCGIQTSGKGICYKEFLLFSLGWGLRSTLGVWGTLSACSSELGNGENGLRNKRGVDQRSPCFFFSISFLSNLLLLLELLAGDMVKRGAGPPVYAGEMGIETRGERRGERAGTGRER